VFPYDFLLPHFLYKSFRKKWRIRGFAVLPFFDRFLTLGVKQLTETTHARPTRVAVEVFGAVTETAEACVAARMNELRYCAGRRHAGQQATEQRGFSACFSYSYFTFLTVQNLCALACDFTQRSAKAA
jgi:hypothetical protein